MKVNLIYDMRYGGAGIGGFSEERKEDAVIAVLRSARHKQEFKKIIEGLEESDDTSKRIRLRDLLDFSQENELQELEQHFNIFAKR